MKVSLTKLAIPRTAREKACAEFVLKGAITRLALMFQTSGNMFTGPQVAEALLTALVCHEYGPASESPLVLQEGQPVIDGEVQP